MFALTPKTIGDSGYNVCVHRKSFLYVEEIVTVGENGVKVKHSPILRRPANLTAGGLLGALVLGECYIRNLFGGD